MTNEALFRRRSAFEKRGLQRTIEALKQRVRDLYLADRVPWVIGYSGGKDSTAVAQLIWLALAELDKEKRVKPVFVITTDTLVENPIVASWVRSSLTTMRASALESDMPFEPHLLEPDVTETFWVNLIGRGYPAPRPRFRWCTERLKIKPSSRFIQSVVSQHGEVILFLGARRAESSVRAARLKNEEPPISRPSLTPHPDLANTLVCTPIVDWSNDDVWTFLMRFSNPWGHSNKELMALYRGATEDNECPIVVDTSTPSCGNSRFGCWVCTLVDQDKSMAAMIQNDHEKEWMLPLLELRNELDFRTPEARDRDRARRDFRRLGGHLSYYRDQDGKLHLTPGPYTQEARAYWLSRVLEVQTQIQSSSATPAEVRGLELVTLEQLNEIRRIWVEDKSETEDLLPDIYLEKTGRPFPADALVNARIFDRESLELLKEVCGDDSLHYEMVRNLLKLESDYVHKAVRHRLFDSLERVIKRSYFYSREDAEQWTKDVLRLKVVTEGSV